MADQKSELYEVKRMGFTPTKNSGRGYLVKADAVFYAPTTGDTLMTLDIKEANKSFALTDKVWAKVTSDAKKNQNSEPIIKAVIGEQEPKTRLVVITEDFYLQLHEAFMEKYYPEEEVD